MIKEIFTGPAWTNTYLEPSSLQMGAVLVTLASLAGLQQVLQMIFCKQNLVRKKFYKYKRFFFTLRKIKGPDFYSI